MQRPSIDHLPTEIMSEIFLVTQSMCNDVYINSSGRAPFLPFRLLCHLTAVSSTWRSIAIDLPFLWTNIRYWRSWSLDDGQGTEKADPQFCKVLQIWELYLQRSKSSLLELHIGGYDLPPSPERTSFETLLLPHLWRVKTLRLHLTGTGDNLFLLPLPPNIHLQSLGLHYPPWWNEGSPIVINENPALGPSLRTLSIYPGNRRVDYDSISAAGLEEVTFTIPCYPFIPTAFLDMLGRSASLRRLKLHHSPRIRGQFGPSPQPVFIPIVFLDIPVGLLPLLYSDLRTPDLRTLAIRGGRGPDAEFPSRPLPTWHNLSEVTFEGQIRKSVGLFDLLVANPSITSLTFRKSFAAFDVMAMLLGLDRFDPEAIVARRSGGEMHEPVSGWVSPNLENLEFHLKSASSPHQEFGYLVEALFETRSKLRIAARAEDFVVSVVGVNDVVARFGERFVQLSDSAMES